MQLAPIMLTGDLRGAFARSACRFKDGLSPRHRSLWHRIVARAATAGPPGGREDGDAPQSTPAAGNINWDEVWQPDTLIAPLLPEPAIVRGFRHQTIADPEAAAMTAAAFAGRLTAWCETLDDTQQAMLTDLLVRAGGDGESEAVLALLPEGSVPTGEMFAPVEFFDYQNALNALFTGPKVPATLPVDSVDGWGRGSFPNGGDTSSRERAAPVDLVEEWGLESFPASDPPPSPGAIS